MEVYFPKRDFYKYFSALMASKAAQKFSKIARNYEYYTQLLLSYLFYYKIISCSKDLWFLFYFTYVKL
jgi:hypothetical protein